MDIKIPFKLIYTLFIFSLMLSIPFGARSESYNGFDLSNSSVPKDEIMSGGPPKDGIPAILEPKFTDAKNAKWIKDDDLLLGVHKNGTAKAYPIRILVWHEAVNDSIYDDKILVNYCPLCGSAMVFKREVGGNVLTFGISGLLHQSNVLFYDHQTGSLWSQLDMKAVSGEMKGTEFDIYPSTMATWKEWKKKYPNTLVLSRDTGFTRDYSRDPYSGYESSKSIMFPVNKKSPRFHPKEKILVVKSGEDAKAYPFSELEKAGNELSDKVGNTRIDISFNDGELVEVTESRSGKQVESLVTYWFAWYAFRPDTPVYSN